MLLHGLHGGGAACKPPASRASRQLLGLCQQSTSNWMFAAQRSQLPTTAGALWAQALHSSDAARHPSAPSVSRPAAVATSTFLDTLSDEQKAAVLAKEQHVRVIAGPGSGKTRTVIARVIWLLKQGASPKSILVITFTRKAAEELRQRLEAELQGVPAGLMANTFHSLCVQLLRRHQHVLHLHGWSVADEDDVSAIIKDILTPKEDSSRAAKGSQQPDSEDDDSRIIGSVSYFRSKISDMKNFVQSTHKAGKHKSGADILKELHNSGQYKLVDMNPDEAWKLASVYDSFILTMRRQRMLDYDDLLHYCLVLVHNHPEIKSELHAKWQHVLVDEGQDINLCQFELVKQITGQGANLYIVGDPDQAIYAFRGAKSGLLQDLFQQLYPTSTSYFLSDNYRCRPAIVRVADLIRGVGRRTGEAFVPGRSKRPEGGAVQLMAADDKRAEADSIAQQLQQWHKLGYGWNDMAVLCRTKLPLAMAYRAAVAAGIPAHILTGDLWDSVEVKTALALLRAVVHPAAAGEGLRRRVIGSSSSEVKVPLTKGLGPTSIDNLAAAIYAPLAKDDSSSAGSAPDGALPPTLGSCLLSGCGLGSLSVQEAAAVWQQWEAALAAGGDPMSELQQLAPSWQQLPGLKALTRPQQAGINRLRGLVQLAAAAATLEQSPREVLQLLLDYSGVLQYIEQSAGEAAGKDLDRRKNRLRNLLVLLDLADRAETLMDDADIMAALDGPEQDAPTDGDSSSSDASSLLRQFMDLCALQGDGGEGEKIRPRVSFMTIHASKGKEFGCVVTMAFYEGVLPSSRAETPDELEQERNTAYVAVTRAKDHLLLIWPKDVGFSQFGAETTQVSRYLKDVLFLATQQRLPGVEVCD